MDIFILCLAIFLVGCMLGYGLEVLFRRFFSAKKWVNPGFMKGPWLPLYGFGLLFMFLISFGLTNLFPSIHFYDPTKGYGANVYDLIPIAVMGVAMNVLEFLAGLIFVKGFKVRLWDYSNMKGNFMGILCPVFSVIWFSISVLYYYAAHPFVTEFARTTYAFMFGDHGAGAHFGVIFSLGVVYGIFLIDLVQSIGLFSKVVRLAKDSGLSKRYEEFRIEFRLKKEEASRKFMEALPANKAKEAVDKTGDAIKEKIREALFIDPSIEDAKANYGPDGRPLKEEEK